MASRYSDKFFNINQKKGTLEINKDEVRQEKPFRDIIERDKGGVIKGDFDGRKKLFAFKELYYVYIMADPFNMYAALNKDRRHTRAMESTGLKQFDNWKPDSKVKEAIKKYKELVPLSPIAFTYLNARKALQSIGKDIELLNDYSEELRERIKHEQDVIRDDEATGEELEKAKISLNTFRTQLNNNNTDILNITKSIPDRIKSLEQLKKQLAEEDSELEQVIGGGTVFQFEDPNS